MLPDDSIEIIYHNNNEDEKSPKIPDVEMVPVYNVDDEPNFKDIKILLYNDMVAEKLITLGVPFLCTHHDIVSTIFPTNLILKDDLSYRLVKDGIEKKIELSEVKDHGAYHYRIYVTTLENVRKPLEENPKTVLKMECAPQCSTPKSIDSQETYFEAEKKESSPEHEEFYSCLDDENDIVVKEDDNFFSYSDNINANEIDAKKNNENCDVSLATLHQNDDRQDELLRQDDKESEEVSNAKSSCEIETSRFYSPSLRKERSFTNQSQQTIQLSDSPILSQRKLRSSPRDSILAVYPPPPAPGGIPIYKENYKCLSDSEFLNDVIIDFYLKYLTIEVLNEADRNRTHVFSSQFFTRLSKPLLAKNDEEALIPESERRHIGVKRWTKNVNIFEKDFVVIPINEHFHWNLAIICFPGLIGMIGDDTESIIRPCILFFDSLSNKRKDRIAAILRGYLSEEYIAKMGEEKSFSKSALKIIYPKVPRQSNATDCGLYVLQYVEEFFKNPIMDFSIPLDLSQWFKRNVIKQKRAQIASLITKLAKNYNPDKTVSMPVLQLTCNSESSDEEDLYCPSSKRKNPFCKDNLLSFSIDKKTIDKKIRSDAKSCSSAVLKNKKIDQSTLHRWIDNANDESSSSDQITLSLDFKDSKDQDDNLIDSEKDDVLLEEDNVPAKNGNNSLEIIPDFESPKESSLLYKPAHHKYNYGSRKIGLIKNNFSGTKAHIFQRKSIYSDEVEEQSTSGAHSKRDCRTMGRSALMVKLATKYQEQKLKNDLKQGSSEGEDHKKSNSWIDTSAFKSDESFYSLYNVDNEKGISPSISYSKFKIQKKYRDQLEQSISLHKN